MKEVSPYRNEKLINERLLIVYIILAPIVISALWLFMSALFSMTPLDITHVPRHENQTFYSSYTK